MREGISGKYKEIKGIFLKTLRSKALLFLEKDVAIIKKNLQNDMYEDLDKFKEEVERLKSKFME